MKNYILYTLFIILLSACNNADDCIRADGDRILQARPLSAFYAVDVDLSASVEIEIDTALLLPIVDVIAQSNIQDKIATQVSDSVLRISFSSCIEKHEAIAVRIKTPKLESILLNGPGVIKTSEVIRQKSLTVIGNASGDCNLLVDVESLTIQSFGTGELRFAGEANNANILLTTSADFYGYEVVIDSLNFISQASGNAQVRVRNLLRASLEGSGDVYYKGRPQINRTGNGSGRVIDSN